MTAAAGHGMAGLPQQRAAPEALAPWPFVERRREPRDGGLVELRLPHPRVPGEQGAGPSAEPAPSAEPLAEPSARRHRLPRWQRRLLLAVLLLDALAALTAERIGAHLLPDASSSAGYAWVLVIGPVVWLLAVALFRGYEPRFLGSGTEEFRRVVHAGVAVGVGVAVITFALDADAPRAYVASVCMLTAGGSALGRYGCRIALRAGRRSGRCQKRTLLVGQERTLRHLHEQLRPERRGELTVVGACVIGSSPAGLGVEDLPALGRLSDVRSVVTQHRIDTVAVAASAEMHAGALRRLAWDVEGTGVELLVAPGLVEVAGPRLHIRPVCGLPLLHVEEPELSGGRRVAKAAMDRFVAAVALLVLLPLLVPIGLAVRCDSRGPALYRQQRVGRHGRPFRMWKFRTMHVDADKRRDELCEANAHANDGVLFKVVQDPRVTRVGRRLRQYSLDELPQFWNVLRGDMSLVGPRPPLPTEVARYGTDVHRRLLVKPGLTGLWQVSGRSDLSWDESIRLDLRYVENWSLALDVQILLKTFAAVVRGRGAY
jgi:exopolysaccharide biosynthesis polyprenyl glycosylphosphotransferase